MSRELTATPIPTRVRSFGQVWLTALARPSISSYAALGQQARVSARRPYTWVFVGGMIGGAINALSPFIGHPADQRYVDILLLALIPVSALLAVGVLAAFAWCTQAVARRLKGSGSQRQLAYVFGAFSAPLLIVASVLDLIPPARVFNFVLYLYWMVLYIVAVRAVNGISRVKATAAVLAGLLILGLGWLGIAFMGGYWGVLLP